MRLDRTSKDTRQSALWGKPKGETRSSALWGKPGRGLAFFAIVAALAAPVAATAGSHDRSAHNSGALVPASLMAEAQAHPNQLFSVIVQGKPGAKTSFVADTVIDSTSKGSGKAKGLKRTFKSVNGVAAQLTGAQIVDLAREKGILAITPDSKIRLSVANNGYSSSQGWVQAVGAQDVWSGSVKPPAIAVVDSGVQACRPDFGDTGIGCSTRVIKSVTMTSLLGNSINDGRGHGTLVAGLAAGSRDNYAGVAPTAPIVSIDVMDDLGMAMTSDVIAAADWILANKSRYNIRVANFSLQSTVPGSFMYDPLNKAVEKLWFNGVVVVAAAGNYGVDGQPTTVAYAPGNDPFVITVGAADLNGTPTARGDDFAAPWSAYGYTLDGFAKPDIGAPGRSLIGPVPGSATMPLEHPERVTGSGFMWMSGTSFAAPIVAGAAAQLLAKYPSWTPDQVKGALMLNAKATAAGAALGVGEVNVRGAYNFDYSTQPGGTPPNPNAGLSAFVGSDGAGGYAFDSASWASAAAANASWNQASWASASWAQASWASASWNSASWASASWAQASWASASWNSASWASASWAAASWNSASWAQASWAE
jgi:serine protease AprX